MNLRFSFALALLAVFSPGGGVLRAEVKLPAILGDNAVLQQGASVPVWGTAAPGEQVSVTFAGQKKAAAADPQGKWTVRLDPLKAGTRGDLTAAGANTVTVKNVLVGETWLASGQSNMALQTIQAENGKEEIARADYPDIRLFNVAARSVNEPQDDLEGKWVECSPQTVANFSAVAYFFGRELHAALACPVGLINSSVGGTWIQAWISRPDLEASPRFKPAVSWADKQVAEYPAALAKYQADLAKWQEAADSSKTAAKPLPAKPAEPKNPEDPTRPPNRPTGCYNGMIAPLIPYAIRGVIWYQGEANAFAKSGYDELLPMLINGWRTRWGQGDFPFLYVQLPNYQTTQKFVEVREAQRKTLSVPNTAMAVTIDAGNPDDIHPRNKQVVGHRLAVAALGTVYERKIEWSGPVFQSMKFDGGYAVVRFTHAAGLKSKRDGLTDPQAVGFTIAGEDRVFVPAEAKIAGGTVTVSSSHVGYPAAVRYAWDVNPKADLYNQDDLPASPFRTDDWPLQ